MTARKEERDQEGREGDREKGMGKREMLSEIREREKE